jgi:hypothetical protein
MAVATGTFIWHSVLLQESLCPVKICLDYVDKPAVAGHSIQVRNTSIFATKSRYEGCIMREMSEMWFSNRDTNREDGLC